MALKSRSLGSAGSAVQLVAISGATNATPIVITVGANSRLRTGDRIAIAGITGNTGANGIWTVEAVTATTYKLLGSVGNGSYGGTPRCGIVFDSTPAHEGHSAMLHLGGNGVATLLLEAFGSYEEFAAGNNVLLGRVDPPLSNEGTALVTNTLATPASGSTISSSAVAIAAAQEGISFEIKLPRILRTSLSAWTSGSVFAQVYA